jgi:pectate lyase
MFAIWLLSHLSICPAAEPPDPSDPNRYLNAVRTFADNVLKYGRDTYGPKHTPLFVDGLNIHTHEPVKWIAPNGDRWILCNLASQQNLFRTLDGLTRITGDPKYRQAAMEAVEYAFANLRSPNGLFYWGNLSAYDVHADKAHGSNRHKFAAFYPYYELMWEVDPEATREVIESFWACHIWDWSNLEMNRYGPLDRLSVPKGWEHEYKREPVFFRSKGGSFDTTASDLYYAAAMLSLLSSQEKPLIWAKRLAHRYVETRDPRIGISSYMYNRPYQQPKLAITNSSKEFKVYDANIFNDIGWGDAAIRQRRLHALTFSPGLVGNMGSTPWNCQLSLAEMLGASGNEFKQWALEELTAWGKIAYRKEDNSWIPMLIDGTILEGYILKQGTSVVPEGNVFKAWKADLTDFWAYALAFRATGDKFIWEIARNILSGNGFGDIGADPEQYPQLNIGTECSNAHALLGFLALYERTRKGPYLDMGKRIANNILAKRFHKGLFVPSEKHVYAKLDAIESLVLLHLYTALEPDCPSPPTVWPSRVRFEAAYREKENASDSALIYTLTESTEPTLSLNEAVATGDTELVTLLIAKGADINNRESAGGGFRTPLHRAVISGHTGIVEVLLAEKANVNAPGGWRNETPLHYAAMSGKSNIDITNMLLAEGAEVNAKDIDGDTPLHYAVRTGRRHIAELLITREADVNVENNEGQTPIDVALQRRRWSIVRDLIDAGADVTQANANGQIPLHIAARRNQKDLVEILLEKNSDVNAVDNNGQTPLHMAAQGGHKDIVELLLAHGAKVDAKDQQGITPALTALYGWSLPVTDLLLEKGADVTGPHLAAYTGDLSRIQDLLDANSTGGDHGGLTLLHAAAAGGQSELVNYLIGKGFDIRASTDEDGLMPLHYAAMGNHQDVAETLLAQGAPVDAGETTPLFAAAWAGRKDMARYLISKGADINRGPQTALHTAVDWWSDMDTIELLLELGADVNAQNEVGNTPLHVAVDTWWLRVGEVLIAHGAKIELKNNKGQTPLLIAADYWFNRMARLLIEKGADTQATDNQGSTPLDIALQQDNRELAQLLETSSSKPTQGVAITNVSVPATCVRGDTVPVVVTLENPGDQQQMVEVTLSDATDDREMGRKTVRISVADTEGIDARVDVVLSAEGTGVQQFGNYPHCGDVNGDGFDDLLVTASYWNNDNKQGRAYIYFGSERGIRDKPDWIVTGENLGDYFGEGCAIGDINADGYDDVVIGALAYNDRQGRAYIFLGGSDIDKKADVILEGEPGTTGAFGRQVYVGYIDDDKYVDVVIIAMLYNSATGRIYLFYGGDPMDTVADKIIDGEAPGDRIGREGYIGQDVNGDGYGDILLGARHWSNNTGRAYLFYGGPPKIMDAVCDKVFTGEAEGDQLGSFVCLADIDKDGHADVLLGARHWNKFRGRVYLCWGTTDMDTEPDLILDGKQDVRSCFGSEIDAGHFDSDGYPDLLIGAYNYPHFRERTGRVYLYYGNDRATFDTTPDVIFSGEELDQYYSCANAVGDLNGDSFDDLFVGAVYYPNRARHGRGYVYYNNPYPYKGAKFDWDTANASIGKHTLKVEIPPVPGEQNTEDNIKTVTIEVKEPSK